MDQAKRLRRCDTSIAILSAVDWPSVPRTGTGAASRITPPVPWERWKLNRSGRHGSGNSPEWWRHYRRPTLPHKPREGWGWGNREKVSKQAGVPRLDNGVLARQGERGDEKHAEGGRVFQFVPSEAADDQRARLLDEIEPSTEQKRRKRKGSDWRHQPGEAG